VWDEENLLDLETSKTPKQKITEPKTPYYAPDGAGDGGLSPTPNGERVGIDSASHAEAVRHALSEVVIEDGASSSRSSGSSWNLSEDELDYMERDSEGSQSDGNHSGTFEEHRRKHYDNEFRKAKLLASQQSELAAEEDEPAAAAAANGEADTADSEALNRPRQQ